MRLSAHDLSYRFVRGGGLRLQRRDHLMFTNARRYELQYGSVITKTSKLCGRKILTMPTQFLRNPIDVRSLFVSELYTFETRSECTHSISHHLQLDSPHPPWDFFRWIGPKPVCNTVNEHERHSWLRSGLYLYVFRFQYPLNSSTQNIPLITRMLLCHDNSDYLSEHRKNDLLPLKTDDCL